MAQELHSQAPRRGYEFVPAIATLALAFVEIWAASFPGIACGGYDGLAVIDTG